MVFHSTTSFYAQTNIQLYEQMHQLGYSIADIELTAKAYSVIIEVFAGYFRPSGKTFIAHLVGTASILAEHTLHVDIVCAGLMHAIYAQGNYARRIKTNRRKNVFFHSYRSQIADQLNPKIEEFVYQYTLLKWSSATLKHLFEDFPKSPQVSKEAVTIRMANEIEEFPEKKADFYDPNQIAMLKELCKKVGLVKATFQTDLPVVAKQLSRLNQKTTKSYQVAPYDYIKKPWLRLRCFTDIVRARITNKTLGEQNAR